MNTSKIIIGIVVVILVAAGIYAFFLPPPATPSEDVAIGTELPATLEGETEGEGAATALYRISQEGSQVEFNIDEVLRGEDVTVVGVTSEVAGDIRIDNSDYSRSELGKIRVNARTLETDSDNRNRAIANVILRSDDFEFIEFVPTALVNIPAGNTSEIPLSFGVTGELGIAGVTQVVTFNVTVSSVTDDKLIGEGVATIDYNDFNLTIPEVPFVASVEDEVTLKINFVADRVEA